MRHRRSEPLIVEISTHPRHEVCLRVAADYLGIDERTCRARIEAGHLRAIRDGKVYRIALADLQAYERTRQLAS